MTPDDKRRKNHYAVRTEALIALGQLERALSLADGTDPWSDMRLGAAAFNDGRAEAGKKLIDTACAALEPGSEKRANCESLQAQMGG